MSRSRVLLECLKQKMLQPYSLFPWCCGFQHPSLWEGWRLPSLAVGASHWEEGLGNAAPSDPTATIAKLGAGVKVRCRWREGAEVAAGSSPELAGGMVWFQPAHGDNSSHARPDGVSGKRSGKGRRGALTLSFPLPGTRGSAAPLPRGGRQPPARGWVPPLHPHPALRLSLHRLETKVQM